MEKPINIRCMKFIMTTQASQSTPLLGHRFASQTDTKFAIWYQNGNLAINYGEYDSTFLCRGLPLNSLIELTTNGSFYTVNGVQYGKENHIWHGNKVRINIFALSQQNNTVLNCNLKMRLYELCFEDDEGNKIGDYVPAMRISDNKPGLYDFISKTFYTSKTDFDFAYE